MNVKMEVFQMAMKNSKFVIFYTFSFLQLKQICWDFDWKLNYLKLASSPKIIQVKSDIMQKKNKNVDSFLTYW